MSLAPGVLSVTVEFAKDLKNREWLGRQDPYCIVRVGNQTFRTRTAVDGGRNPVWDETFTFNAENENDLVIDILDDQIGPDDPLGTASCTLAQVRLAGTDNLELPVISRHHERQHGVVGVSLRWSPAGPPTYPGSYEYADPAWMPGAGGSSGGGGGNYAPYAYTTEYAAPPPQLSPYGTAPPQVVVEEVVQVVQGEGYDTAHHHHHHRHHHENRKSCEEEVVILERIREGY